MTTKRWPASAVEDPTTSIATLRAAAEKLRVLGGKDVQVDFGVDEKGAWIDCVPPKMYTRLEGRGPTAAIAIANLATEVGVHRTWAGAAHRALLGDVAP